MYRIKTSTLLAVTLLRVSIPQHMPKVPSTPPRHGIRPVRCACAGRNPKRPAERSR